VLGGGDDVVRAEEIVAAEHALQAFDDAGGIRRDDARVF
jgi:hypothetical protein